MPRVFRDMDGRFSSSRPSIRLERVWSGLLSGELYLSGSTSFEDRIFASLASPSKPPRIVTRDAGIFGRALRGERQKALAFEHDLSEAVITRACRAVLSTITDEPSMTHAPIMLVMAAHAAAGLNLGSVRVEGSLSGPHGMCVVSVPNPARALARLLSPAEYRVARLAVEGATQELILQERNTAPRTISNQFASIFRKLGVSGRRELRAMAVQEYARYVPREPTFNGGLTTAA